MPNIDENAINPDILNAMTKYGNCLFIIIPTKQCLV